MGDLSAFIAVFLRNENGTTAVEYALLVAALVVVVLATATLSGSLTVVMNDAADCVVVGCV